MHISTLSNRIVITGHYGSGKTDISVNLALALRELGRCVTLVDFDIVNPYFRAADSKDFLEKRGIRCIVPEYANTNVDIPAIPAEVYSVFEVGDTAIFDVGGDDMGAVALGSIRDRFPPITDVLYIVNMYRPMTDTPEKAIEIMRQIEAASGMKCTSVVNNSNLGEETDGSCLINSLEYAEKICELSSLPLAFSTLTDNAGAEKYDVFPIHDYSKKYWR